MLLLLLHSCRSKSLSDVESVYGKVVKNRGSCRHFGEQKKGVAMEADEVASLRREMLESVDQVEMVKCPTDMRLHVSRKA